NGYDRITPPQLPTAGAEQYWWASKPRADGTMAQFAVIVINSPFPPGQEMPTLKEIHEHILERRANGMEGWHQEPAHVGLLAGLTFMRNQWSGIDPRLGKLHGFFYHAVQGSNVIEIRSQDVEAHYERSLRIAEAAALTLTQ